MSRKSNCLCFICETPIYRRPSQLERVNSKVYCSLKCVATTKRKKATSCVVCNDDLTNKQNIKYCSRVCSNKGRAGMQYEPTTGKPSSANKALTVRTIREKLTAERGAKCECCGYSVAEVLNIHHIIERSQGGSDDPSNLLIVCPNCHGEIHRGLRVL